MDIRNRCLIFLTKLIWISLLILSLNSLSDAFCQELIWVRMVETLSGNDIINDPEGNVLSRGTSSPLIKYSLTGDLIWKNDLSGAWGLELACDFWGNIVINYNGTDVLKLSSGGDSLWITEIDSVFIMINDIAFDQYGNIIAVGEGWNAGFVTAKIGYDGDILWARGVSSGLKANACDVDPQGNIISVGQCLGIDSDYLTAKYDPDGNVLWKVMVEGPSMEVPFDVCTDRDSNIYIGGAGLLKYDLDGNLVWSDTSKFGAVHTLDYDGNQRLYLGAQQTYGKHEIICCDLEGRIRWSMPTFLDGDGIIRSVACWGDTILSVLVDGRYEFQGRVFTSRYHVASDSPVEVK